MSCGKRGRREQVPAGDAAPDPSPPGMAERRSDTLGMQLILAKLGYTGADGAPLRADARFGPDTRHALCAFQRDHRLPPSSTLDGETLETLLRRARELADRGGG
jgi:peptidoglycan hydrolase-like protein with peptidoglycan-binding domain